MTPVEYSNVINDPESEIITYNTHEEIKIKSYKYQMILDFTGDHSIECHFKKLGTFLYIDCNSDSILNNFGSFLYSTIRK